MSRRPAHKRILEAECICVTSQEWTSARTVFRLEAGDPERVVREGGVVSVARVAR